MVWANLYPIFALLGWTMSLVYVLLIKNKMELNLLNPKVWISLGTYPHPLSAPSETNPQGQIWVRCFPTCLKFLLVNLPLLLQNSVENNSEWDNAYFSSWFQRFQSLLSWFHCCHPVVRQVSRGLGVAEWSWPPHSGQETERVAVSSQGQEIPCKGFPRGLPLLGRPHILFLPPSNWAFPRCIIFR